MSMTIAFGEECSAMALNKLLAKLKDSDSFSIPCLMGMWALLGLYVTLVQVTFDALFYF